MNQPNSYTNLKQWEVTIEKKNQNEDEGNEGYGSEKRKYVTKLQCNSQNAYVREVVEQLESSFQEVCHHINTKSVQANQSETDKNNINTQILQIDFVMAYE